MQLPSDLSVPEEEILRRAKGDAIAALKIAAAYGYELACRDLDKVTQSPVKLGAPK
jgi:nitrogen fixation protein